MNELYKCEVCSEISDNRDDFQEITTEVEDGMSVDIVLWCWDCIEAAYEAALYESRV